jgi:hypothetical protein
MGITDSNSTYGNDEQLISDVFNNAGLQAALSVGATAIEAKCGVSVLPDRKVLTVFNNSNTIVYWGYTNAVTIATGTPIFKSQLYTWTAGVNMHIYLIAGSAGNDCRVTEVS